ncbi:MAG: 3'-5' exonuclease [Burkholderiales bacterium]|nr:3'-5' exonuclease [Burkholderiales bacterium]
MGLLSRLFARVPQSEAARHARRMWAQVGAPDLEGRLSRVRCVVIDTETAGLDPYRDSLIAIGACRIAAGAIDLAGTFEALLAQDVPSRTDNVLVHGIGHAAQAAGIVPDAATAGFLAFAGREPVVGFHTRFDLVVLDRALQVHLGITYRPPYLDLALILPALLDMPRAAGWTLDDWIGHFRLQPPGRHSALSDAFVTAQLALIGFARAEGTANDGLTRLLALQKQVLAERIRQA